MLKFSTDYSKIINNANKQLNDYVKESNIKAFVLGLSGGIDSAITAALAHLFCKNIPLVGVSMPTSTNRDDELERANAIGDNFCSEYHVAPINTLLYHTLDEICPSLLKQTKDISHVGKVRIGNIKARLRMIRLYDMARKRDGLVLSTDNYTEWLLGFWTLNGDVGNLGIIQQLFKTEVYGLAQYLIDMPEYGLNQAQRDALQSCIDAKPTDGLGISDNDLEQINPESLEEGWIAKYTEVDRILINYLNGNHSLKDTAVAKRYEATHFKRNDPYNFTRSSLIA